MRNLKVQKFHLATKQSKALIRIFKQMKDYIVDNRSLLGQREYLQLGITEYPPKILSLCIIRIYLVCPMINYVAIIRPISKFLQYKF